MNKKTILNLFILILFVVFVAEIIFLLWTCKRHLDFTDESFYILSSLYPEQFTTRFSDFGYLNAAIMRITGKNIYLLRITALFILLVSSFGIIHQSMLWFEKERQIKLKLSERYIWILTGMIASTGFYFWGMTTPSYNFYALIGILTASTGFLAIINTQKYKAFYIVLLSIGLILLYMGKPTSAVFFILCITIWTIIAHFLKLLHIRGLIKPVLWSAILFFVWFLIYIFTIYGSISTYFTHIKQAQQLLFQVGYSPDVLKNSLIGSALGEIQKFYFLIPYVIVTVLFLIFQKKQPVAKPFSVITDKIYFCAIAFLIVTGGFFSHRGIAIKWAWGYMAILYAVIAYFIFYEVRIREEKKKLSVFLLLLLFVSISYVFGTSNPFALALAGIYVVISIGLIAISFWIYQVSQNTLPVILCILLITLFSTSTLGQFFIRPYRSEVKLHQHKDKLDILGGVYMDTFHFEYAIALQETVKSHPETEKYEFLVDISGKSGANLILNKKYLGQSWIVWGKTDAYYHFANSILKSIPPKQLNKAMLLTSETLPSQKIMKDLPLNFPEAYTCIGKVYFMPDKEYHLLWLPK